MESRSEVADGLGDLEEWMDGLFGDERVQLAFRALPAVSRDRAAPSPLPSVAIFMHALIFYSQCYFFFFFLLYFDSCS